MRQERIIPTIVQRVTNRANLAIILLVGGMFCLFRFALGPSGVSVAEIAFPFILLFGHLAFSPLPWQWTGDEAPIAGLGRGIVQSLLFNAVWVALVLGLNAPMEPRGPRDLREPPPAAGPEGPPPAQGGHGRDPRGPRTPPVFGLALVNLTFALVFGWVFADKEATESRERSMAGLLRQSRSRALQNQLEPHVLYNALNGLSELVHEDPLAAEEMIARLADLYRMLTRHSEADFVPLLKERLLVEAYLAMEQMRLGDRLRVAWEWPPWADAVILPPLLLQPLVENAIKHGISPCEEGGDLRIACARRDGSLALVVANTGRALGPAPPKGVGLANLEARLDLWMEGAGAFTLAQHEAWTVAEVRWKEKA
ncbi:sensor histidine kinase [Mesoterricola silvestris]|uniref:Signal transduction histidine kinase internal region domain-containing protein n=1 Tax=Mesoterricola silvestris TaxID=2927979 RepID=A0AA48GPZ3_9BACT|nr:histidine kinase [Mesoterricola silvestris]BDU72045.1 hypothetical protein METEAL_12190 [Mesoterricola silvestris]